MSFSKELRVERSPRGYVIARIVNSELYVYKNIRDDLPAYETDPKGYSRALDALTQDDKAWSAKMDLLEKQAIAELKELYKKSK